MNLRAAGPGDAAAIAAIWNRIIDDTTVTFNTRPRTEAAIIDLIATCRAHGDPFLVARIGGQVAGFAFATPFRDGPGYAHVREHSLHLAPDARGRGLGRALVDAVEMHLRGAGVRILVGAISGENAAGLAFHRALDFRETGRMPGLGHKFGRALDLVLMQKHL